METQISALIVRLLVEKYQIPEEEVRPGATFGEMDVDSLTLVELVISIQNEFSLSIPDGTINYGQTISEASRAIVGTVAV